MKKIKEYYNILTLNPWWIDNRSLCITRMIISIILGSSAFVMLIINIIKASYLMAFTSVILIAGFAISAIAAGAAKKSLMSAIVMAVLVGFVLSFFAVSGGNQGFAILWVLLVPMFAVSLLGIKTGLALSAYFMAFIILLFYTPLNFLIADKYTSPFLSNFPVLFICDTCVSVFLSLQKEYYNRKVHIQANVDGLTGAYNRHFFSKYISDTERGLNGSFCVMVIDVNGLKTVNDTLGHEAGDELICAVPKCCRTVMGDKVTICRIGGDEFVIFLDMPDSAISDVADRLKSCAMEWKGAYSDKLCVSIGWASSEIYPGFTAKALFAEADKKMYADKSLFYSQNSHNRRRT